MYHSINFGDVNTTDDWLIVPSSRPVFNPPSQKTQVLDIPGANGSLDISTSLTGYPVFNNREGDIEFYVLNDYTGYRWEEVYSEVMGYLHGKSMKAVLEDDPGYYYDGRFTVNSWKSEKDRSRITISYSVNPFKWDLATSLDNWLWDPFNFKTGAITSKIFKNIEIGSSWTTKTFDKKLFGDAPLCPNFIVNTNDGKGMDYSITVENPYAKIITGHINDGVSKIYELCIYQSSVTISFKGTGTLSIEFRKGKL